MIINHFVRLNNRPTGVYHIGDEGWMAAVSIGQISEFQSELESITVYHCVKRVVIQYCITRVFVCYAHVIHVLSACV